MTRPSASAVILILTVTAQPFAQGQGFLDKVPDGAALADAERHLRAQLKQTPDNAEAAYGLGVVQFFRALEKLGQGLYRFGLRSDLGQDLGIPFLRLPIPTNPEPDLADAARLQAVLSRLVDDLTTARESLALAESKIGPETKLPLRLSRVRLDFTGGGIDATPLVDVAKGYIGERAASLANEHTLMLDRADAAWLQGYCHLLSALADVILAYDLNEWFDHCGHLFFANAETPHAFLKEKPAVGPQGGPIGDVNVILDIIAGVHTLRWPVKDPARLESALGHLEQMIKMSREFWQRAQAESDDDSEWIPNPKQAGAFGVPITQDMVGSWLEFLIETEAILAGTRLVPFWRGDGTQGINLRRVFLEPRPLDLVLWVQGTAAAPYLERGEMTKPEVWQRLQRTFRGDFIGFALWWN